VIAEILLPESDGLLWPRAIGAAIGFDGQHLYYAPYAATVMHRINVPPPGSSVASGRIDIPILGAPAGIMSFSYDAGRDAFWAVGGDGLSIYLLTKSGQATLIYIIDPLTDRPGNCGYTPCLNEAKINYDRSDDTLWYAPDTSGQI
jgi:hypothetical protein